MAGAIPQQLPQENNELASQLKRLESSFSIFAEESNPNQLLAHLGRMAVEFHHLSSKVQKNEQRTSLLQVRNTQQEGFIKYIQRLFFYLRSRVKFIKLRLQGV